jgi:hypothetical protein
MRASTVGRAALASDGRSVELDLPLGGRGDGARDATLLLTAALTSIYTLDAAAVIGTLPGDAGVLLGIAALQAAWLYAARRGRRCALIAGVVLNASLVVLWLFSRTVGLPVGPGGAQPVGVLDTLCALDSVLIVALAIGLAAVPKRPSRRLALARPLAVVFAVGSLSALHVHTSALVAGVAATASGGAGGHYHLFCQLL